MMIAVITWVWQGLAIAGVTAALLACTRRLSAAARHLCWWAACGAVLALPVAYVVAETFAAAPPATAVPVPPPPAGIGLAALAAWATFAAAGTVRMAAAIRGVLRLKRSATPIDPALARRLGARPGDREVIAVSDAVAGACAVGLGRPMILLSPALVDELTAEELTAIVRHERAHLERRDAWWQLLESVVLAVAGWHPAVRLIRRRIALEREAACDDIACGAAPTIRSYAGALVRAAVSGSAPGAAAVLTPGAAGSPSLLRRRIDRLRNPRLGRARHVGPVTIAAALAAMVVAVAASARIPAVVTVVEAATDLPRVGAPWLRPAGGPPAIVAAAASMRAVPVSRPIAAHAPTSAAVESAPAVIDPPQAPDGAPTMEPLPGRGLAAGAVTPTRGGTDAGTSHVLTASPAPWMALGHSAAAAGVSLGSAGAAAGTRAAGAGRSIGRFFTRAGRTVAGRF